MGHEGEKGKASEKCLMTKISGTGTMVVIGQVNFCTIIEMTVSDLRLSKQSFTINQSSFKRESKSLAEFVVQLN